MHVKIIFFLTVIALGGFFYLYTQNPGVVTVIIAKDYSYTLPVVLVLFLSFLIGVFMAGLDAVITDAKRAVNYAREKKKVKVEREARISHHLAMEALSKGDAEQARGFMEKALASMPGEPEMVLTLADTYLHEGKAYEALDVLETESFHNPGSVVILTAIGRYALEAGETQRAARAFEDALKVDPRDRAAILKLRDIKIKDEEWEEAVELENKLLGLEKSGWFFGGNEKAGKLPGLLYEVASGYEREERLEEASEKLKEVLKKDDFFIPAYILLSEISAARGGVLEETRVLEKAYSRHPVSTALLIRLEESCIKGSAPQKMLELYKKEIETHPGDVNLRILLARFYLRLEMVARAIEELEKIHHEGKESFYTSVLLGEAFFRQEQSKRAASMFKDALGLKGVVPYVPFTCAECGHRHKGWRARCNSCGEWNTLVMTPEAPLE
ncbi:MAG: tetratricopeptide repeat protein [Thermodesulfobacteriota bacterium]